MGNDSEALEILTSNNFPSNIIHFLFRQVADQLDLSSAALANMFSLRCLLSLANLLDSLLVCIRQRFNQFVVPRRRQCSCEQIYSKSTCPFIGCASHRFKFACKKYLEPFENNLKKINDLMITLSHIKQAGKLRKKQISNGMLRVGLRHIKCLNDILKSKHLLMKRIQT